MQASAPRTLLAFDYGRRRIGVAVGQELTGSATALETLPARDGQPDWDSVTRLIKEWQPNACVIGLPVNMDGTEHELAPLVRRFGNRLHGRYNLPIYFIDERLSSHEAEQRLREGQTRGRVRKEDIDREAARLILLSFLERKPEGTEP